MQWLNSGLEKKKAAAERNSASGKRKVIYSGIIPQKERKVKMNKTKALTDEQIAQVRERHANGETQKSLAAEYHVSPHTISNYVKQAAKPAAKPAGASDSEEDILDFLFNVARGFGIFADKHLFGEFCIRVIKERDSTIISAARGDKEIMIKTAGGEDSKP